MLLRELAKMSFMLTLYKFVLSKFSVHDILFLISDVCLVMNISLDESFKVKLFTNYKQTSIYLLHVITKRIEFFRKCSTHYNYIFI